MTLQDYISLSQDSINIFFNSLGGSVANIVAAIATLVVGLLVGYILKRILVEILQAINLEKSLSSWSPYQKVARSHGEIDITSFFGELLRWLAIIIFLIPAIQALQIVGPEDVLYTVVGYIPNVVLAALFLILGFVLAWFVHRIVQVVAVLVGNNPASLIANINYLAIVIFAGMQALLQLGVTTEVMRMLVIAVLVAGVIAIGLGGRDQAMELVKKLIDKAK